MPPTRPKDPRTPPKLRPGERPERPRLRNLFAMRGEAWLLVEPHRIGMIGGASPATLLLAVQLLRQLRGAQLEFQQVILWALLTFVVSYALVGIFVWYLLYVGERELPVAAPESRHAQRLGAEREPGAATQEDET